MQTSVRDLTLVAVKVVHTAIWALVEAAVGYLLLSGVAKRSDRKAAIAGAVVAIEGLFFLANGARCPLTGLAESLGAESGSVTDIYLPGWFARQLPLIHVPVVLLILALHRRAFVARFRAGSAESPGLAHLSA